MAPYSLHLFRTARALGLLGLLLVAEPSPAAAGFRELYETLANMQDAGAGPAAAEAGCLADGGAPAGFGPSASPLCDNLYRFSCSPGAWNDGTGVGADDVPVKERTRELRRDLEKKAEKEFLAVLGTPKAEYFRRIALSNYGLTAAPGCEEAAVGSPCNVTLAQALARQVGKDLFPPPPEGPEGMDGPGPARAPRLRDLDYLRSATLFRSVETKIAEAGRQALSDTDTKKKIETEIYPTIQRLLADFLERKIADPKTRRALVLKVKAIEFLGTDCSRPAAPDATGQTYDPSLTALLEPNAFYSPANNTFRFCNGFLLQNKSEFQIAQVIAHELAHSVGPCMIAQGPEDFRFHYSKPQDRKRSEQEYPLAGLLGCLRKPQAWSASFLKPGEARSAPAGAPDGESPAQRLAGLEKEIAGLNKKIAQPKLPEAVKEELRDEKTLLLSELSRVRRHLAEDSSPSGEEARGGEPAPAFCRDDQLEEATPDWIAGELLPQFIKERHGGLTQAQRQIGFANVFRGMCDENLRGPEPRGFNDHPATVLRANHGLLSQPEVRRQMGCPLDPPPGVTYCQVPDVKGTK